MALKATKEQLAAETIFQFLVHQAVVLRLSATALAEKVQALVQEKYGNG